MDVYFISSEYFGFVETRTAILWMDGHSFRGVV